MRQTPAVVELIRRLEQKLRLEIIFSSNFGVRFVSCPFFDV